jgi:hypothetical protein
LIVKLFESVFCREVPANVVIPIPAARRRDRVPAENRQAKPLKIKILRFKSFRSNILARPRQGSSIVTPYSPKIWTSNPPKKFDPGF